MNEQTETHGYQWRSARSLVALSLYTLSALIVAIPLGRLAAGVVIFWMLCWVSVCMMTGRGSWGRLWRIGFVIGSLPGQAMLTIAAASIMYGYPLRRIPEDVGEPLCQVVATLPFVIIAMHQSRFFVVVRPTDPGDETASKKTQGVRRAVIAMAVVLVVLVGMSAVRVLGPVRVQDQAQKDVAAAMGATGDRISDADIETILVLRSHIRQWNASGAPLMRDYLDPTVSADQWVQDSRVHIDGLRSASRHFSVTILALEDSGLRSRYGRIARNYEEKLVAIVALHNAVAYSDVEMEGVAMASLQETGREGRRLAMDLLDDLRPFLDSEQIRQYGSRLAEETSANMAMKREAQ